MKKHYHQAKCSWLGVLFLEYWQSNQTDTFTQTNEQRRDLSGASNHLIESSFWSNQGQAILAQTSSVEASVGATTFEVKS